MILELVRIGYLENVTLGVLRVGPLRLVTLEEPWIPDPDGPGGQRRESGRRESCVPDGRYTLRPHSSARFPKVWSLTNSSLGVYQSPADIPAGQRYGRSAILIHAGNTTEDIEGCVLVGKRHGTVNGLPAVLESRVALEALRAELGPGVHTLQIRPRAGTSEVV